MANPQLVHADFTTMDVPDEWLESVDIIVTDPPYAKEHLWLYGELGKFAEKVLKDKGLVLSIIPHRYAAEALASMGEALEYRWLLAMHQGSGACATGRWGVQIRWKPIALMAKRCLPRLPGFRNDAFDNPARDKSEGHEWQQSEDWAEFCLKWAPPDTTCVLDPMMGTGTVGAICQRQGLDFIGIDQDDEMFAKATHRLAEND